MNNRLSRCTVCVCVCVCIHNTYIHTYIYIYIYIYIMHTYTNMHEYMYIHKPKYIITYCHITHSQKKKARHPHSRKREKNVIKNLTKSDKNFVRSLTNSNTPVMTKMELIAKSRFKLLILTKACFAYHVFGPASGAGLARMHGYFLCTKPYKICSGCSRTNSPLLLDLNRKRVHSRIQAHLI